MKKLISILITLILAFSFASCSVSDTDDASTASETVSAETEQSSEVAADTTEEVLEMVQYSSAIGSIPYPAVYEGVYIISEKEEDGVLSITFDAELDGKKCHLFSLVETEEANEWAVTDGEGSKHYVTVEMNDVDTDDMTQEQQDKVYAMQEGVNDILDNLQP